MSHRLQTVCLRLCRPDVRRGSASPSESRDYRATPLVRPLAYGAKPNRGRRPKASQFRRGIAFAAHQAAEPILEVSVA
jgi:hypothetical protein